MIPLTPLQTTVMQKLMQLIDNDPELLRFFTMHGGGKTTLLRELEQHYRKRTPILVTPKDNPFYKDSE